MLKSGGVGKGIWKSSFVRFSLLSSSLSPKIGSSGSESLEGFQSKLLWFSALATIGYISALGGGGGDGGLVKFFTIVSLVSSFQSFVTFVSFCVFLVLVTLCLYIFN